MTRLGSLVDINPRSETVSESGPLSVIGVPDIDAVSATAKPRVVGNLAAARSARRPAQTGDVLFARISPSMENGKVAIVPDLQTEQLVVSGELLVLRPRPGVDPRLIWSFLRQAPVRQELRRFMTGSTGHQRLGADVLEQIDLPEPGDRRWKVAVGALEQLDAARSLRGSIGDLVAALAATAAWAVGGESTRRSLGEEDVEFRYGTSQRSSPQGPVPVLRIPNVVNGQLDTQNLQFMPARGTSELLEPGDLLMVRTNGNPERLGRAAVYEGDPPEATYASYLIRIRCSNLDPDFLWAWLQTGEIRSALLRQAHTTAGQFNLNIAQLRGLQIPELGARREGKIAALARRARTLIRLSADQLALVDRMIANHLAITFNGAVAAPPPQQVEALLSPREIFLPDVFATASKRQQRLWTKVSEQKGSFGLERLEESHDEYAQLQHGLAVLEQLGVVVRNAHTEARSWRRPDPELELLT